MQRDASMSSAASLARGSAKAMAAATEASMTLSSIAVRANNRGGFVRECGSRACLDPLPSASARVGVPFAPSAFSRIVSSSPCTDRWFNSARRRSRFASLSGTFLIDKFTGMTAYPNNGSVPEPFQNHFSTTGPNIASRPNRRSHESVARRLPKSAGLSWTFSGTDEGHQIVPSASLIPWIRAPQCRSGSSETPVNAESRCHSARTILPTVAPASR